MTKPHWQGGSGGKGSAARNMEITQEQFSNNWDAIFGKKGKTNEQRGRCDDGSVAGSSGTGGTEHSGESDRTDTEPDAYPHDRISSDSNH